MDDELPDNRLPYQTGSSLWEKLKPLARQKRHEPTEAERALWEQLRGQKLAWYNRRRLHSALGYQSPDQFEQSFVSPLP